MHFYVVALGGDWTVMLTYRLVTRAPTKGLGSRLDNSSKALLSESNIESDKTIRAAYLASQKGIDLDDKSSASLH